jgi:hypothetical protein
MGSGEQGEFPVTQSLRQSAAVSTSVNVGLSRSEIIAQLPDQAFL